MEKSALVLDNSMKCSTNPDMTVKIMGTIFKTIAEHGPAGKLEITSSEATVKIWLIIMKHFSRISEALSIRVNVKKC